MKTIRRFTSGIVASIDWLSSQVENHEALVNAAVKDVEKATGKARVQFNRVKMDGKKLRETLQELRDKEELWKERAKNTAKNDQEKALVCLKRSKNIQARIGDLEVQERKHSSQEKVLEVELEKLSEHLNKLKSKRNILRIRETQARAFTSLAKEDSLLFEDIDAVFDRWETTISTKELQGDINHSEYDSLEEEFEDKEENSELKAELEELINS